MTHTGVLAVEVDYVKCSQWLSLMQSSSLFSYSCTGSIILGGGCLLRDFLSCGVFHKKENYSKKHTHFQLIHLTNNFM